MENFNFCAATRAWKKIILPTTLPEYTLEGLYITNKFA